MNWLGDFAIEVSKHNVPETSHGPAMTFGGNQLFLVYLGADGHTLYWSYCPNLQGTFKDWQENTAIAPPGTSALTANDRPAIAFSDNLYVAYPKKGSGKMQIAFFDEEWLAPNDVEVFGTDEPTTYPKWKQPAMAVFNDRMHLVAVDTIGTIWYTWKSVKSLQDPRAVWTQPIGVVMNGSYPALTVNDNQLYMMYTVGNDEAIGWQKLTVGADLWTGDILETAGEVYQYAAGVSLATNTDEMYVTYTGKGKTELYYSWLVQDGQLHQDQPVSADNGLVKTNAPPALAVFNNTLCMAHKANSSNKIYFTYFA
jgi:hypothetical protein